MSFGGGGKHRNAEFEFVFGGGGLPPDLKLLKRPLSPKKYIIDFLSILRKMDSFDIIEFGVDDIVRSGLVKEYIIAKMESGF